MRSKAAASHGYGGDCSQPSYKRKGKEMGKAIWASALILLLACTAQAGWMGNNSPTQAGWMPNDAPAPPPPQATSAPEEPTVNGWMGNEAATSLTQTASDLIAILF